MTEHAPGRRPCTGPPIPDVPAGHRHGADRRGRVRGAPLHQRDRGPDRARRLAGRAARVHPGLRTPRWSRSGRCTRSGTWSPATPSASTAGRRPHPATPRRSRTSSATNPQPAQAWAGALRISAGDIGRYLASLTALTLRTDTAVTNHGYRNGRGQRVPVRVAGRHRRAGGRRGAAAGALLLRQPAADPGAAGQRPLRGEAVDGVRAGVGHRHRAGTAGGQGVRGPGPRQRPGRRPATGDQGPRGQARRSGGQGSRRHHVRVQPDRRRGDRRRIGRHEGRGRVATGGGAWRREQAQYTV